ncbi:MAG: hypothetical protein MUP63_00550 [Candidatus Nanohaloarchaeota archaeon QJJ-7]|nr:hypothetical protein [Candidatus Nanohaloarchaeota archaeon QJJ-7]
MDVELEGDLEKDIEEVMAAIDSEEDWIYAHYSNNTRKGYEQELRENVKKEINGRPYVWEFSDDEGFSLAYHPSRSRSRWGNVVEG